MVDHERIDSIFAQWDKPDSPGCALALIQDGAIVYQRGYGSANLEYDIPITPDTVFHVASISKQFTAYAILLLEQAGKLTLDDDIRGYLPELPDFGPTITIRHLIHHTSGLRDQWELLIFAGWRMDDVITTADILGLVWQQHELSFMPGAEHAYSNTGYTLMALIVERVSGMPFREFCAEHIFRPLEMQQTHFHDDHTEVVKQRAYSYEPDATRGFKHAVLSYATAGATSLFTTVGDLARWSRFLDEGIAAGSEMTTRMLTRGVLNDGEVLPYASGLSIGDYRGLRVVEHAGGDAGFRAQFSCFPDQHAAVVVLGNLATMQPGELVRRVADVHLADVFTKEHEPDAPPEGAAVELTEEQLASKAGVYLHPVKLTTHRLEVRDGKLVLPEGPGYPLRALAADRFVIADMPFIKFDFEGTLEDGSLRLRETIGNGKPSYYGAVAVVTPRGDELAAYAATYDSAELDVPYVVAVENDQLVLKRRKSATIPLAPLFADGFASSGEQTGWFTLIFDRDAAGMVAGFNLSTGRIRNLRFVRRPR